MAVWLASAELTRKAPSVEMVRRPSQSTMTCVERLLSLGGFIGFRGLYSSGGSGEPISLSR